MNKRKKIIGGILISLFIAFCVMIVIFIHFIRNFSLNEPRPFFYPVYHYTIEDRVERLKEAFIVLNRQKNILVTEKVYNLNYYYIISIPYKDSISVKYYIEFHDKAGYKDYLYDQMSDICDSSLLFIEKIKTPNRTYDYFSENEKIELESYYEYIKLFEEEVFNPMMDIHKELPELDFYSSCWIHREKNHYVLKVFEEGDSSKIVGEHYFVEGNPNSLTPILRFNEYKFNERFGDTIFYYFYDYQLYSIESKYMILNDTIQLYDFDKDIERTLKGLLDTSTLFLEYGMYPYELKTF